jgi:hypothetical protein
VAARARMAILHRANTARRRMALQPGDEVVGGWSREQLMRMDAHFVDAVERAIARWKEHTQRRAADMNAPSSRSHSCVNSRPRSHLLSVVRRLHGVELGDGAVAEAARAAQAAIRQRAFGPGRGRRPLGPTPGGPATC